MEAVISGLLGELAIQLGVGLAGVLFSAVQGTKVWSWWQARKQTKALRALEEGVELTYQTFVQSIKASRADGKLTAEEMRQARDKARQAAVQYGWNVGVDVLKTLGPDIDALIARIVKRMKSSV